MQLSKFCLHIFVLGIILMGNSLFAFSESRALLVGLSQYSEYRNSQWSDINGVNDIRILKALMQTKGFTIDTLVNTNATASNIRQALETLTKASNPNDTIYIHFSGHGQPFEDINGDEQDGWDEAFVPIDAQMYYHAGIYEGEKHITDDELNIAFNRIRERIGTKGLLFVVIDACHSGTMSREENDVPFDDDAPVRGTYIGFSEDKIFRPIREQETSYHYVLQSNKNMSPIIVLEACQAWQQNTEVQIDGIYYGPLSYALYTELKNKSFKQVIQNINAVGETMQRVLPNWRKQHIVVETSIK